MKLQSIYNELSWSEHIKIISNKANSVVGLLHRNYNRCPTKTKSALCLCLVRPILEYAAPVWEPYHHTDIYQLEAVQRRAARFVMNCYDHYQSVTKMLHNLEWPTLEQCRDHAKIIMLYKTVHGLVHIQSDIPLTYTNAVNTRGHHLKMQQPSGRIDAYLAIDSFFSSAVKLWNSLQSNLIDSPSLDNF